MKLQKLKVFTSVLIMLSLVLLNSVIGFASTPLTFTGNGNLYLYSNNPEDITDDLISTGLAGRYTVEYTIPANQTVTVCMYHWNRLTSGSLFTGVAVQSLNDGATYITTTKQASGTGTTDVCESYLNSSVNNPYPICISGKGANSAIFFSGPTAIGQRNHSMIDFYATQSVKVRLCFFKTPFGSDVDGNTVFQFEKVSTANISPAGSTAVYTDTVKYAYINNNSSYIMRWATGSLVPGSTTPYYQFNSGEFSSPISGTRLGQSHETLDGNYGIPYVLLFNESISTVRITIENTKIPSWKTQVSVVYYDPNQYKFITKSVNAKYGEKPIIDIPVSGMGFLYINLPCGEYGHWTVDTL